MLSEMALLTSLNERDAGMIKKYKKMVEWMEREEDAEEKAGTPLRIMR